MNWDAVSAIAEIVGATAVVVTLIYLAVQVRQGTKATQGVSTQAASTLDQDFLLAVSRDPATAETWAMYMATPDKLSREQKLQGAFLMASVVRRLENILFQERLGTLSPESWQSRQDLFTGIARYPGFAAFLESPPAALMRDDFLDYMQELRRST